MLMFIVSIVYIAGCVECLDYQRQSKVPNLSVIRTVTPIKASRKRLSQVLKRCRSVNHIIFFRKLLHSHTNVNCNHGVKTMYHILFHQKLQKELNQQLQYNPYLKDNFT